MSAKIAVAIIHGICIGNEFDCKKSSNYARGMAQTLKLKLAEIAGQSGSEDVILDFSILRGTR